MNNKEKQLRELLRLPYTIVLQRDEDDDFVARVAELDGCVADGSNELEALARLNEVKKLWLEAAISTGQHIPQPNRPSALPSGKFLVRIPKSLHKQLVELADEECVSLNQIATTALADAVARKSIALRTGTRGTVSNIIESLQGKGAYCESRRAAPKLRIVNHMDQVSRQELEASDFISNVAPNGMRGLGLQLRTRSERKREEVRACG